MERTVPDYTILKTISRLTTVVGNHHHLGRKWGRLCNRYDTGNHPEQVTFQLKSGRHQEKKVLNYFSNCVQISGTQRSGRRTGAKQHFPHFLRSRKGKNVPTTAQ